MSTVRQISPRRFWVDKLMSERRIRRPDHIRPQMPASERAKQFAPFAALGRMDRLLKVVEEQRDTGDLQHEALFDTLTPSDAAFLSAEDGEERDLFEES